MFPARSRGSEPHIGLPSLGVLCQEEEPPECLTFKANEACKQKSLRAIGTKILLLKLVQLFGGVLSPTRALMLMRTILESSRQWQPTPVFLPGKSHGWWNLVGYSPWGCKELDTTERLHWDWDWALDKLRSGIWIYESVYTYECMWKLSWHLYFCQQRLLRVTTGT